MEVIVSLSQVSFLIFESNFLMKISNYQYFWLLIFYLFLGLAYYMSPPQNMSDVMRDPLHMLAYTSFILISCAFFSKLWIEISGDSTKDRVKQLREQEMGLVGYRDKSMVIF